MKLYHITAVIDNGMERYRVWRSVYAKNKERAKELFLGRYDDGWNRITGLRMFEVDYETLIGDETR